MIASLALVAGLSACGGGGGYASMAERLADLLAQKNAANGSGDDGSASSESAPLVPSSTVAAQCAVPRGSPSTDVQGSVALEKSWVRSWIDETYLWYDEVPSPNASNYSSAASYFADLKSPAITAAGKPKDRFHFTYNTAAWNQSQAGGASVGYGIDWKVLSSSPPRSLIMAQVDPLSNAYSVPSVLRRGDMVLSVDGVDLANGTDVATLNAGLFPTAVGQKHTLVVQRIGTSTPRTVELTSGVHSPSSVPTVIPHTDPTTGDVVGYMLFNAHNEPSEALLINNIRLLRDTVVPPIKDLVLDLRYNGGGLLAVASELAYMIAGPQKTDGKTFEKLSFNDKNPFNLSDADTVMPFHTKTQGFSATKGADLPYLGLSRVYVLTSSETCSASESIINSLRGAGIDVIQIGDTTCGKPYGFFPQDNCGTTYFAIQFKGVNHMGVGDYSDGIAPTCYVPDDFTRELGSDPAEGQLAAALAHRKTGQCPVVAANKSQARLSALSKADDSQALRVPSNPMRNNRFLVR